MSNNKIVIDEAALAAEADAIAATVQADVASDAPAVAGVQQEGDQQQGGDSWCVLCAGLVPVVAITVLPQWNLSRDEQNELAQSLGACLDQVLPGGLNGKYACWVRLIACAGGIAITRAIANGGKLPALGPRKAVEQKQDASAPNPATN